MTEPNDNLTVTNVPHRGGSFTWYFVLSNQDNTDGSQFADCGYPAYGTMTGNNYDGSSPRMVFHTDVGAAVDACGTSLTPNSINVIAYRIFGRERTAFNMSGGVDGDTGVTKQWAPQNFGQSANGEAAWWWDGYACMIKQVHGYESNATIQANIAALKTQFAL